MLDPDGPGSWTHPHLSRMLYADGKVLAPLFRARPGDTRLNKTTGELRLLRAEPDAGLHFEGTGEGTVALVDRMARPAGDVWAVRSDRSVLRVVRQHPN